MPEQRPVARVMSDDQWNTVVRFAVTPSVNVVLQRPDGSVLFVLRKNEPCKDQWWVPGGRVRNGERAIDATKRIVREEVGIAEEDLQSLHVLDRYQEEIFPVDTLDRAIVDTHYGPNIQSIHYWGTAAYARVPADCAVTIDTQSDDFQWLKDIPPSHAIQMGYFRMLKEAGIETLPV